MRIRASRKDGRDEKISLTRGDISGITRFALVGDG
jgi:hypothetical protein